LEDNTHSLVRGGTAIQEGNGIVYSRLLPLPGEGQPTRYKVTWPNSKCTYK